MPTPATTNVVLVSIGGLAGIAADSSDAEVTGDAGTGAAVTKNSTVTITGGGVQITAQPDNQANSKTGDLNASGGLAVGAVASSVHDTGGSTATFDGELVEVLRS